MYIIIIIYTEYSSEYESHLGAPDMCFIFLLEMLDIVNFIGVLPLDFAVFI